MYLPKEAHRGDYLFPLKTLRLRIAFSLSILHLRDPDTRFTLQLPFLDLPNSVGISHELILPASDGLFPNNISTPFISHPHLMHLPRWNINSSSRPIRNFRRLRILGVYDDELALQYQMCRDILV